MALLSLSGVSLAFGGPRLLDGVGLQVERGERVCLLGRNGEGKSTLLKVLAGTIEPDEGEVIRAQGLRIARLTQDVPDDRAGTIAEEVARGLPDDDRAAGADDYRVQSLLSRMVLDPEARVETLSSGMKRRVGLARALVAEPDLLLLDEPTNHLDIESIRWLEETLLRLAGTLIFVTHDRALLAKLATRILELDRGKLYDWPCDYPTFLKRKEELLAAEERQNALFDKRLAQEEVWIRKGIEARRTRNEGRVRALKAMRDARQQRRERQGAARLVAQEAERLRHPRRRGQGRGLLVRGSTGPPGRHHGHPPGGQGRHHRPQRRRQDHAPPPPPRPARAHRGDGPPRHQSRNRLLRPAQGQPRRLEDRPEERQRV